VEVRIRVTRLSREKVELMNQEVLLPTTVIKEYEKAARVFVFEDSGIVARTTNDAMVDSLIAQGAVEIVNQLNKEQS
jgi:hypothetical protein